MTIPVAVLVAAAVIAGYTDLRTRRIPNWLTGGMTLFGLSHHLLKSGVHGLWISLGGVALGAGLILLPMLVPYAKRGIGGGDVKFIAAVGSIVGAAGVFVVFIVAAGVGAIQCLIALWRQPAVKDRPVTIPYGVALSVGTLVVTAGSLLSS